MLLNITRMIFLSALNIFEQLPLSVAINMVLIILICSTQILIDKSVWIKLIIY